MGMTLTRRTALLAVAAEISAANSVVAQPFPSGWAGQAQRADHLIPGFAFGTGEHMTCGCTTARWASRAGTWTGG